MSNSTTKRLLLLFTILLFICPAIPVLAQQGKINVASFQRMEATSLPASQLPNGTKTVKSVHLSVS